MSQSSPTQGGQPDFSGMDISMCPVHNKTSEKFVTMAQQQQQQPTGAPGAPQSQPLTIPTTAMAAGQMDISMCPVHNGSNAATPAALTLPPSHAAMGMDFKDMDISMCPVHNGNDKAAEAFSAMAKYQREQAEAQEKLRVEKQLENDRARRHVSSPKFLEGAPRFPVAAAPVETDDGNVVGDIFPDSKPIFGQRFHLSTAPAQSSIPKSTRSRVLPALNQLPEDVPQVPDHLKLVAQQQQGQPNTPPVCTSDDASNIAIIDGKEVRLPGKDFKEETWTFPSHQRFYNAMKKKGWNAAEVDIPYIVSIHNTINQQTWSKIMQYERFHQCANPSLLKFQGRPQDLSPKARFLSTVGYNPPFDRHDWTIDRCGKDVRYVIDFYDGPQAAVDQSQGQVLATHLDVRPALDSPGALFDRLRFAVESMFHMKPLDANAIARDSKPVQVDHKPQQQQPPAGRNDNHH